MRTRNDETMRRKASAIKGANARGKRRRKEEAVAAANGAHHLSEREKHVKLEATGRGERTQRHEMEPPERNQRAQQRAEQHREREKGENEQNDEQRRSERTSVQHDRRSRRGNTPNNTENNTPIEGERVGEEHTDGRDGERG